MNWNEYISYLLSSDKSLDQLKISLDNGKTESEIPPVIRASISMLDRMLKRQGRLNVFVFPDKDQSIFLFMIMKILHNISDGRIGSSYDPTEFTPGERLKVGNAVVEYLGTEQINDKTFLKIKLADTDMFSTPVENMPIFQKVTTKRKLSKKAQFIEAKNEAVAVLRGESDGHRNLSYVMDMKTHMDSSIVIMNSVAGFRDQVNDCLLEHKKLSDIFYIAKTDYEGNLTNISPGQLTGIPAIIVASDLYAINAVAEGKHPIQSLIINGTNMNTLLGQLDALDELMHLNVPVAMVTDISNSFDLEQFKARGFNIWRWDKNSLIPELYNNDTLTSGRRIRNCARQSVEYLKSEDKNISESVKKLFQHSRETENQSPQIMKLFAKLYHLTFYALRETIPFTEKKISTACNELNECTAILEKERQYLDPASTEDYDFVIKNLCTVYNNDYPLKKGEILKDFLNDYDGKKIILVVEQGDKKQIQNYWISWCMAHFLKPRIRVMYPSEYCTLKEADADVTIISGWFKRSIMRRIMHSYITEKYIILLYDYEDSWRKHAVVNWTRALDNSGNRTIIEKSFSSDKVKVSVFENQKPDIGPELDKNDEIGEIELILKENQYRRYVKRGAQGGAGIVSAIPISFVGGYIAFYRTGHKVVSATKIITKKSETIDMKLPAELQVGDFIVVRETDRDLVREIADLALKNSGKGNRRETASIWWEALQIELLFCSEEELCKRIINAGCDREIVTIKGWINDKKIIAPSSENDLRIIAEVTENETLLEKIDDVLEAAQEIRNAHVLAGRKLSEQLRLKLAEELKNYDDIDPFNIWEPIDIEVEGIGNVKVLKIIDLGTEIQVDSANTNRLITE